MTYGKIGGTFKNIPLEKAGGELLWKWRLPDSESFQALEPVIERMLNNTEMNDEVIFLPCAQQGQMEVEDETPLSLMYDKCFASLMRVARTAWKPLLWNAALALTSSTSARYFLNKPENEGDLTAETLQGGLFFFVEEFLPKT